jgi:radical SAM superfamily enzyme YgiQ (UPF0313 family)
MTPQLQGCVELAGFIKKNVFHRPKIFLGGPHVSADSDFVNRFRDIFDYAITGEAEKTFLESIEKLARGQDVPAVQAGEVIDDLDKIPFPDKSLIERKKYSEYESMIFSRGCPYSCYYCSRPAISKTVRYRSAENLIQEIKYVYDFCAGKIDFQDDTFTINKKAVFDFCAAAAREKLRLTWRCNTRIDLVDEELLRAMKAGGCELIHFGIESASEKLRRGVIQKGNFTNEQIINVLAMCRKLKIKAAGYFMIGHPGETKEEVKETKDMILRSGFDLMGLSIPTPFPGSNLYDIAEAKGIVNKQVIDRFARKEMGEGYTGIYPVYTGEGITKDYLFSLMKEINRKFYVNLRMFLRKLAQDLFSWHKLAQDARDLFSLLVRGVSSRKPYVAGRRGSQ